MDIETSSVTDNVMGTVMDDVVEGVEFLPARERWDQTSYAVASFLARYRA